MSLEILGLGMVVIFLPLGSLAWVQWKIGFNQGGSFVEEFSEETVES